MTVAVSSGSVRVAGVTHAVTGANVTITANASSNPRYDAVVADSAGALSAIAGTPAAEATLDQPSVALGTYAVLAVIYVAPGAIAINAAEIVQKQQTQNPNAFHDEPHALNNATIHTGTLDDAQIPAGIARDAEVTTAVSTHTAASDPHADRAAAASDATTKVTTHEAAADPHTTYQKESEKGAANGYASLDSNTVVPAAQLPAPSSTTFGGVKSHAAVSHEFLTSVGTDGIPVGATITLSDVPALLDSSFALTGDISPTALSADANNYNPTGLSTASTIRISTNDTTDRTLTGLAGGADGRLIFLHNLGPGNLLLSDEDALSTAGNRFALTSTVTMMPDALSMLQYDFTSQRWRVLHKTSGATTPALVFATTNVGGVSDQFLRSDDQIALFDNVLPDAVGTAAHGGIVGPTILDSGIDTADGTSFVTGSVATAAHYNELITLTVYSVGAADPNIPTLTTARGLTIAQIATRLNSTGHVRMTVFRTCIASGGSTGNLTIDFAGQTQTLCAWEVLAWAATGATAANNGSDGVGGSSSATSSSNRTSTPVITLATLEAGSATYAASAHASNETSVAGTGYLELTDLQFSGPAAGFQTEWKPGGTTTPSATWSTNSQPSVIVGVEIVPPDGVTIAARRGHVHATGAGTPTTAAFGDAAAIGAGPAASMTNHVHGMPALGTTTAAVGTAAGGSATTPSKSDHVHATGAGTPSTQASGDAAAVGSGPNAAMDNHKHAMWNDFIVVTFSKQGTVATTTDSTAGRWYNDTGRTLTFASVRATAVTAPTGATLIVDVNKDGTTIFTTQASRPTIAISGNTNKVTNPDVTTIADGSYLTVNVDQVGSTVAGSDLTVQVFMKG